MWLQTNECLSFSNAEHTEEHKSWTTLQLYKTFPSHAITDVFKFYKIKMHSGVPFRSLSNFCAILTVDLQKSKLGKDLNDLPIYPTHQWLFQQTLWLKFHFVKITKLEFNLVQLKNKAIITTDSIGTIKCQTKKC